jgi:hypothetical protein
MRSSNAKPQKVPQIPSKGGVKTGTSFSLLVPVSALKKDETCLALYF